MQGKKQKPGLYLQWADNFMALNSQIFCQQIEKKTNHWKNKLLNMFFFTGVVI